jgi:hypothetical protein
VTAVDREFMVPRKTVVVGTTGQRFPLAPGSNRRFWFSVDELLGRLRCKATTQAPACALFADPQPASEVLHDPGVYP